jgi:hypothetical protein
MKFPRITTVSVFAAASLFLGACGISPIQKNQSIQLEPNEGIAAVVIDALDDLNNISITGTDKNGKTLTISKSPKGVHLYIFKVPAGTYCLNRYYYGFTEIVMNDQEHGDCFDVIAGKIAYSGNFAPRAYDRYRVMTEQNYDWKWFESVIKEEYPNLIAQYPIVTP